MSELRGKGWNPRENVPFNLKFDDYRHGFLIDIQDYLSAR